MSDTRLASIHFVRTTLDAALALLNQYRAEDGLGPVTLTIPEEKK